MQEILNYINTTEFLGIPLDIIAHFVVGMFVIILGLSLRFKFFNVLLFLFFLTTLKEIRDILYYSSPFLENCKDFFFSFLYALILAPVRMQLKGKKWLD